MKKLISIFLVSALILTINFAVGNITFSAVKYELDKNACETLFKVKPEKVENAIRNSDLIDNNYISVKTNNDKVTLVLSEKNVDYLKNKIRKMINQQTIAENHSGYEFELSDDAKTLIYETEPEFEENKANSVNNNLSYILFLQMLEKGNADNLELKVIIINSNTKNKVKTATLPNDALTVEEWS